MDRPPPSVRILIVEDDQAMLRGLKDSFESAGYSVATACTGPAGVRQAAEFSPNLILLDLMLPLQDGFSVCSAIRKQLPDSSILILTARDDEPDIVRGLKAGADDYVTKPFSLRELNARCEALLRRHHRRQPAIRHFAGFQLDLDQRRLLDSGGRPIKLSPREFALLDYMSAAPGRALSRDELLRNVWGNASEIGPRTVDRFVTVLRRKLGASQNDPIIETIRDYGYRFTTPVHGRDNGPGQPE